MDKEKLTYKLPEGWVEVKLEQIVFKPNKTNTNKEKSGEDFYYIDINSIDNKLFKIKQPKKYTWAMAPSRAQQILKTNDIIFSTVRPYLKNIALIPEKYNNHIASTGFCIIRPIIINPKYVYYFVITSKFINSVNKLAKGTSYPAVNNQVLFDQIIPIPPLYEQQRIVSKIEELFSELDHAEEGLKKSQKQLEIYKQALMKSAFNGKMTEKWRHEKWSELSNKEFPDNWSIAKIENYSEFVGSGSTPKGGKNIYISQGVPFIRSQNILSNFFNQNELVFITKEINNKMSRTQTRPKDVLLNITGASIGRCAFIPETFFDGNVNQHVCIIRVLHEKINYKYLTFYLNSPSAQLLVKRINSGATREALTLSQIKDIEFPLCSLEEQHQIVLELESHSTLIDNLNNSINLGFERIKIFRHSILNKAFYGKLVPQNPNDESGSLLLKKIQKEKEIYLIDQREIVKLKPTKKRFMENKKTIIELLKEFGKPMLAEELWKSSIHKEDIDAFYGQLKKHIENGEIEETERSGKKSFLKLPN